MKTLALCFTLTLVSALGAFTSQQPGAIPEKINGIDVYVYSSPGRGYDVIETGKVTALMDCTEVITKAVKKSVAQKADAVIVHFESSRYEAIRYK